MVSELLILALITGAGAGIAHVYLGVDHLAALVPISHGRRQRAFWLGVRWGVGHSLGVILVAAAFLGVRELAGAELDVDRIGAFSERIVGVMLIALGLYGLRAALSQTVHSHPHEHDGEIVHEHLHVHSSGEQHKAGHDIVEHHNRVLHGHASLLAGALHGLAGMSHLWGVLPTLALPLNGAMTYLLGFGLGSMLAMGAFAAGYGYVSSRVEDRLPGLIMYSRMAASGFCLLIGVMWLVVTGQG